MKIEVVQTYDIDIPEPPRHLRETGGKRASIPIGSVPSEVLRQIGEHWTQALIDAAYPPYPENSDTAPPDGEVMG